jgi:hypothetical protein
MLGPSDLSVLSPLFPLHLNLFTTFFNSTGESNPLSLSAALHRGEEEPTILYGKDSATPVAEAEAERLQSEEMKEHGKVKGNTMDDSSFEGGARLPAAGRKPASVFSPLSALFIPEISVHITDKLKLLLLVAFFLTQVKKGGVAAKAMKAARAQQAAEEEAEDPGPRPTQFGSVAPYSGAPRPSRK